MKDHQTSTLEDRLRDDLVAMSYPNVDWVRPVDGPGGTRALDCAIIGAGQMGLTIASGLKREHVNNVVLFDRAKEGCEGPWLTFARMQTLRTPKNLTGPDLGIPSLGFRAWWIDRHDRSAWDNLGRIPRTEWMAYLSWYRRALQLDVRNEHELVGLAPLGDGLLRLEFETQDGRVVHYARTVVLATGSEGGGGHVVPRVIADAVPQHLRAHTNDMVDVAGLAGKKIGILGAGASAFDFAIAALEAGAASVDLCFRRMTLPQENPRRWMETPGFLSAYTALPDQRKWSYLHRLYKIGQPPPLPTYQRAIAFEGFRLHPSTPWDCCRCDDGRTVTVTSGERCFQFDFVLAATGISNDLAMRPELAEILPQIALWEDLFEPPRDQRNEVLGRFPYLGAHGEFKPRHRNAAPWVSRIYYLARPATLSLGPVAASNSALKYVGPQVIRGVVRTLMLDQADADWDEFVSTRHPERPVETGSRT